MGDSVMDSNFQFPLPVASDPGDVSLALETAAALWRKGDSREALRWLRRAAETAETEGDDMRALTLARAAADLKDLLPPGPPSLPPSAPSTAPPASMRVTSSPSVAPGAPARTSSSPSTPPSRASSPSAAPAPRSIPPAPALVSTLTQELGVSPAKLEAWSPPSSRGAPDASPATKTPPASARPAAATPASPPASSLLASPNKVSAEPPTPIAPVAAARASETRAALRVSVETMSKGSGALLVRVLGEGEKAPAGTREALLVPTEAGVDLQAP